MNALTKAMGIKCPAELYQPSTRPYQGLPDIDHPFHHKIVVVTNCGRICLGRKRLTSARSFAGQAVASWKCTMIFGCLAGYI
jgi:putative transposase